MSYSSRFTDTGKDPETFRKKLQKNLHDVGVRRFNDDHRRLLANILDFHEIVEELLGRKDKDSDWKKVKGVLAFLESYTVEHFKDEEKLMERNFFPGFKEHKHEHEKLLEKFSRYKRALLQERDILTSVDLKFFLLDWFFNHTGQVDLQYKDFFQEKNIL